MKNFSLHFIHRCVIVNAQLTKTLPATSITESVFDSYTRKGVTSTDAVVGFWKIQQHNSIDDEYSEYSEHPTDDPRTDWSTLARIAIYGIII